MKASDPRRERPDYCPDEVDDRFDVPCPACGATINGDDPVRGVCQARFNGRRPRPYIEVVLIDRQAASLAKEREAANEGK